MNQQELHRNMLNIHSARGQLKTIFKILAGSCLALALFLLLSPGHVSAHSAHTTTTTAAGPTLLVDIGFDSTYRSDHWTPVHIVLSNHTADFRGTLSLNAYTGPPRSTIISIVSPWSFEEPVVLPRGALQQTTVYMPMYLTTFSPRGIVATLRDKHGKVIVTQAALNPYEVRPGNLFIGILSDPGASFDSLSHVSLPNQTNSLTFSSLDASTFPTIATVLKNFDVIILDDFPSSTLSPNQLSALQTWVNQGGVLIEVGGPAWQRTLSTLPPELLPVIVNGTTTLPAGTHLLPVGSSAIQTPGGKLLADTLSGSLVASTATLRLQQNSFFDSETVLASGTTPLIVQARQGQGVICYLAFDPARPPLADWPGTNALWGALLLHALGDKFLISNAAPTYYSGPGEILTREGVLSMVAPEMLLGPWIIAAVLFSYLMILGPIRLLIVRRLKRPQLSWVIIVSSIVIFSLLSYGLAFYQKGASLKDNSISIIQINQGGSSAHITTYSGIFVPSHGDFNLDFPGESLAQPIANEFVPHIRTAILADDLPASIVSGPNGTNLKLMNIGPWTFHLVISEQDRHLHGGLVAQLSLQNNRLVGTITNTLSTSLSDVYVLIAHSFVRIGSLASGETQHINLSLNSSSHQPAKTLADQIAESSGLPASYFPYSHNEQPQSDFQRHMALLAALEGAGYSLPPCNGSCNTHAIISAGTIFVTGGGVPNPNVIDKPDPLLIPGAPATLIGWADQPPAGVDELTINGTQPGGQHQNFIQMPLTIDVTSSLTIPPDFITGRVIDIQSYDAQLLLPSIYSMSTGSLTFEFTLPNTQNLQVSGLTITTPDLLASPTLSVSGKSTTISYLQARLYNWHTNSWDTISLSQDSFTTANTGAYIGPSGRVLMQISNQNGSRSRLFFSKPFLILRGSVNLFR